MNTVIHERKKREWPGRYNKRQAMSASRSPRVPKVSATLLVGVEELLLTRFNSAQVRIDLPHGMAAAEREGLSPAKGAKQPQLQTRG